MQERVAAAPAARTASKAPAFAAGGGSAKSVAATAGDFTVETDDTDAYSYNAESRVLTINGNKNVTVKGSTTSDRIEVQEGARLTLDSIKIPVFSAVTAYGLMRLLQQLMLHAHDKSELLTTQATDQAALGNLDKYNELFDKATDISQKYLVGSQMWYVSALLPTLIVFSVMCLVTILLTRRSFKMFTPNIAYSISKGRKRR